MTTTRVNTNTYITKKNATRSDVWRKFLELREAGRQPVLMDSSSASGGWSFVCVPDEKQPERDEDLEFLVEREFEEEQEDGPPFIGGWVGFMTYNQGALWKGIQSRHECKLPLQWWKHCNEVYAFKVEDEDEFDAGSFEMGEVESNISWEEYERGISEVKKLLREGETYQVNFAQQFAADFDGDPFALYAALFQRNPSAMCFFAEGEGWAVCSNSPERIFSLKGRKMRTEPIKGTVARDADPQFLLNDVKSYAELTMIVDLVRNDFGKVAKVGSVKVLEHQALMELKNVWHTYSVVEAELVEDKTIADLIKSMFPGGSIVGCPKKRTMEIIDRLVDFSWGAYCGSAGYVSKNGNADFNIMIRTAQVIGEKAYFGAGGGIVMDSDAKAEFQETKDKAATFIGLS